MSEETLEYKEPVTVLYQCDGKKCKECDGTCTHTNDIHHAENFIPAAHNQSMYMETTPFTPNQYQQHALRTAQNKHDTYAMLIEGVMGLNGEAGECIDIVKKYLYQGHGLDRDHLAEELGDVAWYLAVTAYAIGYPLSVIMQGNLQKLKERYPEGFDPERSVNRDG